MKRVVSAKWIPASAGMTSVAAGLRSINSHIARLHKTRAFGNPEEIHMPAPRILFASAALALSAFGSAAAADLYPWRNHEAPFSFVFGNEIDTHQQTRLTRDGSLFGFFYVRFTGVQTKDHYAVATHVDCNTVADCTVGWTLSGKPISAVGSSDSIASSRAMPRVSALALPAQS